MKKMPVRNTIDENWLMGHWMCFHGRGRRRDKTKKIHSDTDAHKHVRTKKRLKGPTTKITELWEGCRERRGQFKPSEPFVKNSFF